MSTFRPLTESSSSTCGGFALFPLRDPDTLNAKCPPGTHPGQSIAVCCPDGTDLDKTFDGFICCPTGEACGKSISPNSFRCADPSWVLWTREYRGPTTACCMQGFSPDITRYCLPGTAATPSFNWTPLVKQACSNYEQAKTVAPNTLGYFGQIVNIVCAAAKGDDPCCADMSPYYKKSGCEGHWAGAFDQYVFNSFLGPNAPSFNSALETMLNRNATDIEASAPWFVSAIFKSKDWGSLLAGHEHFVNNLGPAFSDYIHNLFNKYMPTCNIIGLSAALDALSTEHNALFECAVEPGFTVEGAKGEISLLAVRIAQLGVPVAAAALRNYLIISSLPQGIISCLKDILPRRDTNDNGTPSVGTLQKIATFMNLTTPKASPLLSDPRAWIPKEQPLPSVLSLPSAYFQILPNSDNIKIEFSLSDSRLSLQISTDRSAFNSEAVAAVSLIPINLNSSDLTTAYLYPDTSIHLFGLMTMIIPSTAPFAGNKYLFLGNVNTTFAQRLNQSSVFDNGYNVLFNTFNLSLSYDGLPNGVDATDLLLIDVVDGSIMKSTVDASKRAVNAVGLKGHGGEWGGGGIYAIGYAGTTGANESNPYLGTGSSSSVSMPALLFATGMVIVFSVVSMIDLLYQG
ncbi:hypothetical protein FOXYS1_10468 [Fusarium oxysporum]|uniref:Uncharacterized protein n=1 Tax=Fusarium oxysporum TaxID=5507 RepID=A0A8H5EGN3_FUSOX|nr:hypothetical protein FOXYS1_10468 [Fusarium oxysporum]